MFVVCSITVFRPVFINREKSVHFQPCSSIEDKIKTYPKHILQFLHLVLCAPVEYILCKVISNLGLVKTGRYIYAKFVLNLAEKQYNFFIKLLNTHYHINKLQISFNLSCLLAPVRHWRISLMRCCISRKSL